MSKLVIQPITQKQKEAFAFIARYHRHHDSPRGYKFAIGCSDDDKVVGVVVVGRPVARSLDNGWTAEFTRNCVIDGHPHVASKLYAAAWRAARAMGYQRLITYVLRSERGTSVHAAGWRVVGEAGGGTWNRPNVGRPRVDTHPIEQKTLWEIVA